MRRSVVVSAALIALVGIGWTLLASHGTTYPPSTETARYPLVVPVTTPPGYRPAEVDGFVSNQSGVTSATVGLRSADATLRPSVSVCYELPKQPACGRGDVRVHRRVEGRSVVVAISGRHARDRRYRDYWVHAALRVITPRP